MTSRGFVPLALAVVIVSMASAQTPPPGEIAGRIADAGGGAIPGARVAARSAGDRREAVTDAGGRFILPALPVTAYDVTVELAGFRAQSGRVDLTPATRRAYLEWTLEVGCIEEVQRVVFSPRDAAPRAHAIVYVRAEADYGAILWSNAHLCGSVRRDFAARVVAASPERSGGLDAGASIRILGEPRLPALAPGRDYVALLWRTRPKGDVWTFGDRQVLPVVDGFIRAPSEPELDGLSIASALATLGRWSTIAGGRLD